MSNNEYQELQHLRELWTGAIMIWAQIFIPLGIGIIILMVTQLYTFIEIHLGFWFIFFGWLLYSVAMGIWRTITYHIDRQIVQLYPRMLELEKEHKMEIQTRYFFNNLAKQAKKKLAELIGEKDRKIRGWKYEEFKQKAGSDFYDKLLSVWEQYSNSSVSSRGHCIQNICVIISSLSFLGVICFLIHNHYLA